MWCLWQWANGCKWYILLWCLAVDISQANLRHIESDLIVSMMVCFILYHPGYLISGMFAAIVPSKAIQVFNHDNAKCASIVCSIYLRVFTSKKVKLLTWIETSEPQVYRQRGQAELFLLCWVFAKGIFYFGPC